MGIEEKYNFSTIDEKIIIADEIIYRNIESEFCNKERGLLSQNILNSLRTFVEYIIVKIYLENKNETIVYDNKSVREACKFLQQESDYNFINEFHYDLQISKSHYTTDDFSALLLMHEYYDKLVKIKDLMKSKYHLDLLKNIDRFPFEYSTMNQKFYEEVASGIEKRIPNLMNSTPKDNYYVLKKKTFYVGKKAYYELTLTSALGEFNKFNRTVVYSCEDILTNYAVKISVDVIEVNILEKKTPISVLQNWQVAIRPCEIINFAKILGEKVNYSTSSLDYLDIMKLLTNKKYNLLQIADFSDSKYETLKLEILTKCKHSTIFNLLDICGNIFQEKIPGYQIIRYLLYSLNNSTIKDQYHPFPEEKLSGFYLKKGCIPFETMPFATSLVSHNTNFKHLVYSLNPDNREDEIFASYIKEKEENENRIYLKANELNFFSNIEALSNKYNSKVYEGHTNREIILEKDYIFTREYETDTLDILRKLKDITEQGYENYEKIATSFLKGQVNIIDCEEKRKIIKRLFQSSKVALIYGSAGTGKTTFINYISELLKEEKKIYLACTNSAVNNLKNRINDKNGKFYTTRKYLSISETQDCDILIIDECSTIGNKDMRNILNKGNFKLLLLVGDTHQIESIHFGNWFQLSQKLMPIHAKFELTQTYRSKTKELQKLWNMVREEDKHILEFLIKNNYSHPINSDILKQTDEDEIILCLNYDGLFGINNINRYLQNLNPNPSFRWGIASYKINDPILFNDSKRFQPILYNNLKGIIKGIQYGEDFITFQIEVEIEIHSNELPIGLKVLEIKNGKTLIQFNVTKGNIEMEDANTTTVPFSVAYAISIHKAQGLEYNSVKIIIDENIDENITPNIFYTAITRAQENLKIYWEEKSVKKILDKNFEFNDSDYKIIKSKLKKVSN